MKQGFIVLGILFLAGQATAQTPVASCAPGPRLSGCPNDYGRKPWPVLGCLPRCGGCDDYCRKVDPWVWRMKFCGGCDDYARKPCPAPCRPLDTSRYLCWPQCLRLVP